MPWRLGARDSLGGLPTIKKVKDGAIALSNEERVDCVKCRNSSRRTDKSCCWDEARIPEWGLPAMVFEPLSKAEEQIVLKAIFRLCKVLLFKIRSQIHLLPPPMIFWMYTPDPALP